MRNYGDEQIRRVFEPEFLEQIHKRAVEDPNRGLKNAKKLGTAERPAILQHDVVLLLDANAGQFAQDVQPIGKILKLNEFDLPIALLLRNHCLKRNGRVAVPSSTIMEDDVNSFHWGNCATGFCQSARALSMPCG